MSSAQDYRYSIIVPCYCSGDWLDQLVQRVVGTMDSLGDSYEIILVNDASPDSTWGSISELANENETVRGIDLMFNTGQFRTIICGLQHARGDYIILLDDDFQNPPEEIPKLIEKMRTCPELDCVMGEYAKKQHSLIRNLGSDLYRIIIAKLYRMPTSTKLTSFVIMKQQLAEAMCMHGTVSPVIGALIYRTTNRVANTPVVHHERVAGESGYSFLSLIRIVLDNVFSASVLPLRLLTFFGSLSVMGGFVLASYYVIRYLSGGIGAPGFMTQVILIIFFGGMSLFSIGLLGEYLIRIIDEVRRPPRYVVRGVAGDYMVKSPAEDAAA